MIIKGEEIKKLIPQRYPMMMVDEFEEQGENNAVTALKIVADNYFLLTNGDMSVSGVIEHIAQSCSALAGFQARQKASESQNPPVGMIAEVKNFNCTRFPKKGETIHTNVSFGFSFGQMTLAHGISTIGTETIAEVDLKIFMQ